MNEKYFLIDWKKAFIISIILLLILLSIYLFYFIRTIKMDKTKGFTEIKQFVIQENLLHTIADVHFFQEKTGNYILFGRNDKEIEEIVFMNDEKKLLTTIKQKDIIAVDQIKAQWSDNCKNCSNINVVPAIIDKTPLWELTYYDNQQRYMMEYQTMTDGTTYEKFSLARKN